jgi:SPT2 chromatin protein
MAAATQSESERSQKLARLRAIQQSESIRQKEIDLAAKEREKHERWEKVLENHEKQLKQAEKPTVVTQPPKPKVLQPVCPKRRGRANLQQRSMTFKKLLKQAAKIDSSTFKVGPKVKSQPKVPEKPRLPERTMEKSQPIKSETKTSFPARPIPVKPASPKVKSAFERTLSSTSKSRSASPLPLKPQLKKLPSKPIKSAVPAKPLSTSKPTGKDAKSRLRESFVPDELIPLAQGPKRDLRTIEEIQNDLWRKKGKNYPSVTGKPKELTRKPIAPSEPIRKENPLPQPKKVVQQPNKRPRNSESSDEDSFIASSEEEIEMPDKFDYRAEIRAMFGRKGNSRVIESEDDSDMEATGFEMAREEARAAKLARMEDEEEERRLEERAREKKRRKLEAERKKKM